MDFRVITVYSLKGGSGKSTITLLTALYLKQKGYRAAIIDMDKQQCSSVGFVEAAHLDIPTITAYSPLDRESLAKFQQQHKVDFFVIDSAPRDANARSSKSAIDIADFVLMPIQPSQLSVHSFFRNEFALMKGKKKGVVINGATIHNQALVSELWKTLQNENFEVIGKLGYRKAFNLLPSEPFFQKKNYKAVNEIGYLIDKTLEHL